MRLSVKKVVAQHKFPSNWASQSMYTLNISIRSLDLPITEMKGKRLHLLLATKIPSKMLKIQLSSYPIRISSKVNRKYLRLTSY